MDKNQRYRRSINLLNKHMEVYAGTDFGRAVEVAVEVMKSASVDRPKSYTADNIGKRIGAVLREKGMTQTDLARKLDMNRCHISSVISGKRIPRIDTLCRIANALEVNIEYFLGSEAR